jgi:WD40 repeat protein
VEGAVTAMQFANSTFDKDHELLAIGSQSGELSFYKIPKTRLERGEGLEDDDMGSDPKLSIKLKAHKKAITSVCFIKSGAELITTSADWTLKLFETSSGAMLNQLLDTALIIAAVSIPAPKPTMVVANANCILRFVVQNEPKQKTRMEQYARSLCVGMGGQRLLAGTNKGWINCFDVTSEGLEKVQGQEVGTRTGITCMTIIPCKDGSPPLLVANCMDNTLYVLQSNANLTNFTVMKRMENTHSVLPLRSSHIAAPGRTGYVVSGSEAFSVVGLDLDSLSEFKLDAHKSPVMDVACCMGGTLMASADVKGNVIFWRRGATGKR